MKHCTLWPQPSKLFPRKFLIFFPKKICSENISYMFSKESFSDISGNRTLHYSAQALKIKKICPEEISYASGNGNPEITYCIFLNRK